MKLTIATSKEFMKAFFLVCFLIGCVSKIHAQRDSFLWPFTTTSIWNMPIGSAAVYQPAGFKKVTDFANVLPYNQGGIAVDDEPIIVSKNSDPLRTVYNITNWNFRCNTTSTSGKQIRFPSNLTYADPNGSSNTPNFSGAVVQPDGSLWHFNAITTCGTDKIAAYDYTSSENSSLKSTGHEGGHGGSGLSGIGGSIRKGELLASTPIRHAIKLNVLASRYLVYNNDGTPGYRWPANRADGYANPAGNATFGYGTSNTNNFSYMEMGALVAIQPSATPQSLGITNPIAIKIFYALQDYGAYIVDDTYWNHYDIPLEEGVADEVLSATGTNMRNFDPQSVYYQDMFKIITALYAITNNSPTSIGGGGTPRQPLAPDFAVTASVGSYKIMPLGDSKTEGGGGGGHQSWRGYLRAKLMTDGYTIDYVGDRSNFADGDGVPADNEHAGHGGYTIGPDVQTFCPTCETTGLYEHVDTWLNAANPDVVLLAIGVNDFYSGANHPANYSTTAPQRYQNLVNKILQTKPNVTLVLGTVEPVRYDQNWGGNPSDNDLGALNAKIKAIADLSTTDKIFFADIRTKMLVNWGAGDYYDDVHFAAQGAIKNGNAWYDAVKPLLTGTTSVAVTGVTMIPTTTSVTAGSTASLTATVAPANATNKNVTWASSNTAVATVGTTGVVSGVAAGTATVTVTTQDGSKTATCVVTVTASGGAYTYEAENGTFGGGGQTQSASNASNGSVVGNLNAVGSYTQVSSVNGGSGGTASLVIRYANGFSSTSTIGLYVNNTFIQNVSFPVTGGWNTFANATVSISLPSGTGNTIKLQIGSGNAAADIDKYTVTPSSSVAVTGVTLSPTTASLLVGGTSQLIATVAPANATNKNATWSSSNTAIATVSTTGVVTGAAAGTATVTVTTTDGSKTATCAVTVTSGGGSATGYEAENGTFGGGGQIQTASNASNGSVIGNLNAVGSFTQVSSVNGGSGGTASLVIRYANGFSSTSAIGLYINNTFVQNVSFPVTGGWNTFSDATVSISLPSGTGNTIKLQIGSGNAAADIDKYTVTPGGTSIAVTGVTMSPTTASVVAGATTPLTATVAPANATNKNVTWSSSNTAIATVNAAGIVTGVAAGTATITVTTTDGNKTATCVVTVTSASVAVTAVTVSPTTASVVAGATTPLTATVAPANATNKNVTWSSSNTAVATVNATGVVTGVAAGSATITVTTQDGSKTATSAITVTAVSNGTNLLSTNPSFESQTGVSYSNGVYNGITGWLLNNTAYNSISVTVGSAQQGNNKLNLVYGGKAETLQANRANVTAGQTYTLGVAISKVANTNTAVQSPIFFRIDWYNSSNALISSSSSGNILGGGTSAWATYTVTAAAPASAVKAGCYVELVNTSYPNNDVASFSVDNVRLNSGATVSARSIQTTNTIEVLADNKLSTSNVNIYPNPLTTGSLIISTPGVKGSKHLKVYDAAGNTIYKEELPAGSLYKIDLSKLNYKGVCLVEVSDNTGLVVKKLIKQ